jgi:hypothetical protein
MGALADFWKSEKGLLTLAIIICATVLAGLNRMTTDQWTSFVQIIFGAYVVGKTATGVAQIVKGQPITGEAPAPAAAPAGSPAAPPAGQV